MNRKQIKNELKSLSQQELAQKVADYRQELLALRLNAARTHVKSFANLQGTFQYAIACGLTLLRQTIKS